MKILYKFIVYTFLVNVATGLLLSPFITGWEVDFQDKIGGFDSLNQSVGGIAINPVENPTVDPSGFSLFDNIFGIQIFGWLNSLTDFIKTYLFGMVGIILSIVPMDPEARGLIQASLYLALTLLYGFGIASFITGKRFDN